MTVNSKNAMSVARTDSTRQPMTLALKISRVVKGVRKSVSIVPCWRSPKKEVAAAMHETSNGISKKNIGPRQSENR